LYGSGFPKSHNISKAINAKQKTGGSSPKNMREDRQGEDYKPTGQKDYKKGRAFENIESDSKQIKLTEQAKRWEGYGTALKPAYEPIILAMKPIDGTYAENALKHDVAGLNIDGGRIPYEDTKNPATNPKYRKEANYKMPEKGQESKGSVKFTSSKNEVNTQGRFPANVIHDGIDLDGKERYFYCAKASKKERNMGLENFEEVDGGSYKFREDGSLDGKIPSRKNTHPTVKPLSLMEYLVKLLDMPNDEQVILDPFTGSGTTLMACKKNGINYIGIEKSEEYIEIAEARVEAIKENLV